MCELSCQDPGDTDMRERGYAVWELAYNAAAPSTLVLCSPVVLHMWLAGCWHSWGTRLGRDWLSVDVGCCGVDSLLSHKAAWLALLLGDCSLARTLALHHHSSYLELQCWQLLSGQDMAVGAAYTTHLAACLLKSLFRYIRAC
jgi:hypothetical protein